MKNKLVIFLAAASMLLVGCKGNNTPKCVANLGDELAATPYTDSMEFAQAGSLEGKRFASTSEDPKTYDHYGYVTLRSCTDGDTANFVQEGYVEEGSNKPITIKTRFLGVNTPESTAKVEPWGKKASLFTKHQLEEAQANADEQTAATGKLVCNIALITDPDVHGVRDSSGNRWLAFVWYRKTVNDKWRCINLELVEQAYSRNQLFLDSQMCNYREYFEKAHAFAESCGYRVFGATDPGFDYTTQTYEYSIWGIQKHYDDIGISDEGGSGKQLIVTALVVGIQGDNLYLRDVLIDEEQYTEEGDSARLAGTYGYAGFGSALCSTLQAASASYEMDGTGIGLIIRFYCRATKYSGNIQLSDIQAGTTGKKALRIIKPDTFDKYKDGLTWSHVYATNGNVTYDDLNQSVAPIELPVEDIDTTKGNDDCKYTDLLPYAGQWVTVDLKIRAVNASTDDDDESSGGSGSYWYNPTSGSTSYTVYAKCAGKNGDIFMNIRVDTSLAPFVNYADWAHDQDPEHPITPERSDVDGAHSPVGHTWRVVGYLVRYYDKFQIQLGNNYSSYNYLTEIN